MIITRQAYMQKIMKWGGIYGRLSTKIYIAATV
jgi:hypothetical protein